MIPHPDADALYVSQIDIGTKVMTIVSGLRKHCTLEQLIGRDVVLITNLKPGNMRGVESSGMVLCASQGDTVEPISPPKDAIIGEKVTFAGMDGIADAPVNPKKLPKILSDLASNNEGIVCYRSVAFMTSKGPCTSNLKAAPVK